MMTSIPLRAAAAVLMASAGVIGAADTPAPVGTVDIREWPVPWKGRPRDPFVDAQGRVWFVGQAGHYLGRLDPVTGTFRRFDLEGRAGPHNLVVDADGAVWFSANLKGYIGRFDPATGKTTPYPMPDAAAGDPHTLAIGRGGSLWFTVQAGNFVGRLSPQTGAARLVPLPTPGARPYGIVVDSKGRPWFNEFGTNKIGSLDPDTLRLEEHRLPDPGARSRRIAVTTDGAIWYTDYARGTLGRLDPASGRVREWPLPGGSQSLPYALAADDRDRLWAVETGPQPNRLVGFDPKLERVFSITAIPSGAGTVRHMVFEKRTREIWFGTDHDTIGRARIP